MMLKSWTKSQRIKSQNEIELMNKQKDEQIVFIQKNEAIIKDLIDNKEKYLEEQHRKEIQLKIQLQDAATAYERELYYAAAAYEQQLQDALYEVDFLKQKLHML